MSRASVLAAGRRAAEAGMVDACVIRRITSTVTDPDTAQVTPEYEQLYTGRCRVQVVAQMAATGRAVGDQDIAQLWATVQLPVAGTEGLRERDQVLITASAHDSDLVGRVLTIHETHHKTEATARRVGVRERTPEE